MIPNSDSAKLSPLYRGNVIPKQTPTNDQVGSNHHDLPSTIDSNDFEMRNNNMIDDSTPDGKNEESFISSSSSGLLVGQHHAYSGTETTRNTKDDTEPHTVSFDLDSSNDYECIQQTLYYRNQTPQRRQRRARDVTDSSASGSFLSRTASSSKLCFGISDLVDDALTRVADAMFDGMRCGMDDTCHRWAYVPGEDSP